MLVTQQRDHTQVRGQCGSHPAASLLPTAALGGWQPLFDPTTAPGSHRPHAHVIAQAQAAARAPGPCRRRRR
jgi:hypothetical protein